ncbi:hypothetical protein [Demequina maris]|uniref:hypothetical protein n=1 Tax=Demequina maris TaxID=1638982 RepID=UPI0012E0995B|nr:hypothetical protein [Demequina maris]
MRGRALAACCAALVMSGCTGAADANGPDAGATSVPADGVVVFEDPFALNGYPTTPTPRRVSRAYNKLEFTAFAKYPEDWGGCYIDGDVLVVATVTRTKAEAEQRLRELLGEKAPVRVVEVDHSIADLEAARDVVGDAMADAARRGAGPLAHVHTVGPGYGRARLTVGVDDESHVDAAVAAVHEALETAFPGSALADIDLAVWISGPRELPIPPLIEIPTGGQA